ncbi:MAG TPA: UDP-N-acetylmuramoyl-L-alanyl-D-glutamate--2,6-diaminopimelate ligase [bacterium]|nr:UDP-N-acetylmuramoyl-L-alanyl-D-glutamate--2,6-diaminopimelate ligase [bacterium]HOR57444.1 UDP-N-acetylmuramoyl-L-alanyl-D-glutamate--2,6-diaminopimelate ligase [bacterium]HPL56319.1 UDP-N-acetylmuramoyl-L-alanyl-D-glutamate--2,6-diaminopimelate ligase [bacterium]
MKKILRKILPRKVINFYHLVQSVLANILYGFPSRRMRVLAITGTNGKTSTAFFVASILRAGARKVGMLTTVRFVIDKKEIANKLNMTTVNPFLLQRYLRKMCRAGCTDVVLEVTSHAIAQHRIWGIRFDAVALTNISHDHLDYHGTIKQYVATKKQIFGGANLVVLNKDDEYFAQFAKEAKAKVVTYGLEEKDVDVTARKILSEPTGTTFTLLTGAGQQAIRLQTPGRFNVANALCATSLALGKNISLSDIKTGLEAVELIPGRMERVLLPEAKGRLNFSAIIDYAHTPDALEKVLLALRPATRGKIIAVYGATGDRDKSKRSILGEIGGRLADVVIITDEEPYTEDPQAIINAVASGVEEGGKKGKAKKAGENFFVIKNRMDAICKAIDIAGSGDVVIVTGMGDQSYKVIGQEKVPWSDRDIVAAMLRKKIAP